MTTSSTKGKAWSQKEDETLCKAYRWVLEDSIKGISQTSEGSWTRTSKKYYEFYKGTIPPNPRNHESCSSQWKKQLHPRLNKWNQALIKAERRHASGANLYDEVRQVEQLYMDDMEIPFTHQGYWEICKGWVLFRDPPQEKFGTTPLIGNVSSNTIGDEEARKLKEEGKENEELAFREKMATSLRLMAEQNAITVEERKWRHEEQAKQIQEEMNDRNMERDTTIMTPMSMAHFERKKRNIMAR
ncbi:hypothetical protein C1H46_000228 [Malus baccata]|uniref:Myb-like domain-containing protein n=1 Tax=Malus baccata TaxID=106549 RepID=A0A540NTG3_MALBA|nr:hypothetical protein C1H46_000228 [Malus baccata]